MPGEVYLCVGFCAVEVVPSPKFQSQVLGNPVEVSEKLNVVLVVPLLTGALKFAAIRMLSNSKFENFIVRGLPLAGPAPCASTPKNMQIYALVCGISSPV